jgi:hypothetical protein
VLRFPLAKVAGGTNRRRRCSRTAEVKLINNTPTQKWHISVVSAFLALMVISITDVRRHKKVQSGTAAVDKLTTLFARRRLHSKSLCDAKKSRRLVETQISHEIKQDENGGLV